MRWWTAAVLACLVCVSCTPAAETSETTTSAAPPPPTVSVEPEDSCTSGELEFHADGLVAALGDVEADATTISQIRWDAEATCERMIIRFATGSGAPATTIGLTGVALLASAGLVRVELPAEVTGTAVADMWTDGGLVDRTYIVRDEDGEMFVDVHGTADAPIAVRAFATRSPATIVIDFISQPDLPTPVGTTVSDFAVVITPSPGPALYPFTVEGYAQPSLRSVHVQLEQADTVEFDTVVALDGDTDAWQSVKVSIEDGPAGASTLFVGQVDINGRRLDGALVPLDLP
ncbi:MAG: hypothetical protein ACR2N7_03035 [Acidimicrobiia bacterium]